MKNLLCILIILAGFFFQGVNAQETQLLTGFVEAVPQSFYGTWRVVSKLDTTDSAGNFKKSGIDVWNLSRSGDVITLCNVFNGAKAVLKIDKADSNYIVFTKIGKYGFDKLTDKVEIYIDGDTFRGFDTIELETYNQGKKTAKYKISGEKISGELE